MDGKICNLAKLCQVSIQKCKTAPRLEGMEWIENREGDFNLWAAAMKATSVGKASLDHRVRDRPEISDSICKLLVSLAQSLEECYNIALESAESSASSPDIVEDGSDSETDDDSATSSVFRLEETEQPFYEHAISIRTIIGELARICAAIRKSGSKYRHAKADDTLGEDDFTSLGSRFRFAVTNDLDEPEGANMTAEARRQRALYAAQKLTEVQERLVRANVVRQNRIEFIMRSRGHMASSHDENPLKRPRMEKDSGPTSRPLKRQEPSGAGETHYEAMETTLTSMKASPSFKDHTYSEIASSRVLTATDIGSKFNFQAVAAKPTPSTRTKITSTGETQDYPRPPRMIADVLVRCPYCADLLSADTVKNERRWRGHVAQDILPYTCFFEECESPEAMFHTSQELSQHVKEQHGIRYWICDHCAMESDDPLTYIFESSELWAEHMVGVHRDIFSDQRLHSLSTLSSRVMIPSVSCPLCGYSSVHPSHELDEHILQHLHSFALLSLPWGGDDLDQDELSQDPNRRQSIDTDFTDSLDAEDTISFYHIADREALISQCRLLQEILPVVLRKLDRPWQDLYETHLGSLEMALHDTARSEKIGRGLSDQTQEFLSVLVVKANAYIRTQSDFEDSMHASDLTWALQNLEHLSSSVNVVQSTSLQNSWTSAPTDVLSKENLAALSQFEESGAQLEFWERRDLDEIIAMNFKKLAIQDKDPSERGGERIGRPPQWPYWRAQQLLRLYVYTTLPMERIILAIFPNDDVKKNSAQKTLHKMVGSDPRPLRPANREDMNIRAKHLLARLHFPTPENEEGFIFEGVGDEMITDDIYTNMSLAATRAQIDYVNKSPLPRNNRSSSLESVDITDSIRSMAARLDVSLGFAKTVLLVLRYSDSRPPEPRFGIPQSLIFQPKSQGKLYPDAGLATPGDFIVALAYDQVESQRIVPTQSLADSWSKIAEEISKPDLRALYLDADGELCQRAQGLLSSTLNNEDVSDERDPFGNTLLHVLAARKRTQRGADELLAVISKDDRYLSSTNTAQQTFMHVLDSIWFTDLNDTDPKLLDILRVLKGRNATRVLHIRDVYGNTFFHRLWSQTLDKDAYGRLLEFIGLGELGRNAFGVTPGLYTAIQEQQTSQQSMPLSPIAWQEEAANLEDLEASRLNIATMAYTDPYVEDEQGRNGLQCLVDLYPTGFQAKDQPSSSKRTSDSSSRGEGTYGLAMLRQYLQGLLTPTQGTSPPDVNHYDNQGETTLMSVVRNVPDGPKDAQDIRAIITLLAEKEAMIDARNSHGETALLIAAQTGRRTAFLRLLELGANVHARDSRGRGVAVHITAAVEQAGNNLAAFGQCEALRAVTAKALWEERGAKFQPTMVDEWSLPSIYIYIKT